MWNSNYEELVVSGGLFAPNSYVKIPVCKCKTRPDYVDVNTDRDDFIYDECPICHKMIRGSARTWEEEDGDFDW